MESYLLYATKQFYSSYLYGHITKNIIVFNVCIVISIVYGFKFWAVFENMSLILCVHAGKEGRSTTKNLSQIYWLSSNFCVVEILWTCKVDHSYYWNFLKYNISFGVMVN